MGNRGETEGKKSYLYSRSRAGLGQGWGTEGRQMGRSPTCVVEAGLG